MSPADDNTVFVALREDGDWYRESNDSTGVADARVQAALRLLLPQMCHRSVGRAEINGRLYRTSLYVSDEQPGVAYAETDHDGVPVDAPHRRSASRLIVAYARRVASRFRTSDALTPDTRVSLDTAFVPPRFSVVDDEARTVTWSQLPSYARVILSGDPGAGKTSSLRRLALDAATDRSGLGDTLPVYVQLRDFPVCDLSVEGITRLLRTNGAADPDAEFAEPLHGGRLLLLLDGFDEIATDNERDEMLGNLRAFCQIAPDVRVVLASRDEPYPDGLDGFTHLRLLPFDQAQVAQWMYQYLAPRSISGDTVRMINMLRSDAAVADVIGNPLLLGLTTSLYYHYPNQRFDRAGLLGKCVEVLVQDWDAVRGVSRWRDSGVTPHQILALLTELSARLLREGRNEFTIDDVHRVTGRQVGYHGTPAMLLSACHTSGLVTGPDGDRYRFRHRTLEDYLAASHLVRRTDDLDEDSFERYFLNPPHRQVWSLACAQASDADDLLRGALSRTRLSPLDRATMVAEAMGQELAASRESITACARLVTTALEESLDGLQTIDVPPQPEGGDRRWLVVWMAAADAGTDDRLDSIARLLMLVYQVCDGAAGPILLGLLHASGHPAVRAAATALEFDGWCTAERAIHADRGYVGLVAEGGPEASP